MFEKIQIVAPIFYDRKKSIVDDPFKSSNQNVPVVYWASIAKLVSASSTEGLVLTADLEDLLGKHPNRELYYRRFPGKSVLVCLELPQEY